MANTALPQGMQLRHRDVLTRNERVRLRFIALPAAGAGLLALMVFGAMTAVPTAGSVAVQQPAQVAVAVPAVASMAAADPRDEDLSLGDMLRTSQKRLRRSMDEASDAERLALLDPASGAAPRSDIPQEKTVKIGAGDTLTGVLNKAGLSSAEAYGVAQAVKEHLDLRALRPGQVLNIRFDPARPSPEGEMPDSGYQFASLNMDIDALRSISVARGEADREYKSNLRERDTYKQVYLKEAPIEVSVFGSAAKAGIPQAVVAEAIRIYSWHVDFQRDIRRGDKLQVMYEQIETEDGTRLKTGNVVFAKLTVGGVEIPIYRHEMEDGRVDFFLQDGRSIRKTLMKTPVDGARMSSGFGMRRHPIQGYHKMHKGIDFAAPSGTPIYAAGDGVVEMAGRRGGYGNYIRIRHNTQLKTAYAHMSRFAKGMTNGRRVRQGEVIGYVGTTGSSTGPHLHYEVLLNGVQVNPRSVKLPTGEILEGEQLRVFQARAREIDGMMNGNRKPTRIAMNKTSSSTAVR